MTILGKVGRNAIVRAAGRLGLCRSAAAERL